MTGYGVLDFLRENQKSAASNSCFSAGGGRHGNGATLYQRFDYLAPGNIHARVGFFLVNPS
jgi:hypothetical protein